MILLGPYDGSYTWFEACIYRFAANDSYTKNSEQAKTKNIGGMIWESQDDLLRASVTQVPNAMNGERTWLVQRNVRASSDVRQHIVTWTDTSASESEIGSDDDGDSDAGRGGGAGFVRSLVAGDRIALKARALVKFYDSHRCHLKLTFSVVSRLGESCVQR
jgi:hypothetical protein